MATISVITPVKNEAATIERSLASLLQQQGVQIQHIIIDGNSTDGTLDIINRYMKSAPYTTRLITGSCSGVYQALNEGINQASGDYIAILHASDSLYSPTCLAKALEQLQATDADIFFADLHFVNKAGRRIRYYSGARFRPDSLRDGFMFPHPTMVVKRTKALEVGPYNPEYAIAGDFEWIVRAVLIHRLSTTYLKIDMVEMTTGGISTKWRNRLYFTAREKYISLKSNGIKVSPLRLLRRYIYLFNR